MRYFPIFIDLSNRDIALAGGGEAALAKLRLLLKTPARIAVFAPDPAVEIAAWAAAGRITLHRRRFTRKDAAGLALVYAAQGDRAQDAATARAARAAGALVNCVDDGAASDFLTPALVDRAPVVVAIGTEGTAPVLARRIKAEIEARLAPGLGTLARLAGRFRRRAEALPSAAARRAFWRAVFDDPGSRATAITAADGRRRLNRLLAQHLAGAPRLGHVDLAGAGPGDPELLTLQARDALDRADVVIHDRLVDPRILELARREARLIAAGKEGHGPAVAQDEINHLMVRYARAGAHVLRLKGGDPAIFARLEEEIDALEAAGISWRVIPGITAASAAAAVLGRGLTARGRNAGLRLVTGHDATGFAEQDWQALARPGTVAAFYMARRAARFIQGRLLMHGAAPHTPICLIENASHPDQRVTATTLARLPAAAAALAGPAVLLYGLAPRTARSNPDALKEAQL